VYIDYVLLTCPNVLLILEPDINFLDHLPLFVTFAILTSGFKNQDDLSPNIDVLYPRWNKADTCAYYGETGVNITPLLPELDKLLNCSKHGVDKTLVSSIIDQLHDRIVLVLRDDARHFVPSH